MSQVRDLYEVLEVSQDAGDSEIKKAYRRLAMKYHPDRNPDDPDAEEQFKEASNAYKVLSDADQRARYDRYGHEGLRGGRSGFDGFSGVDDIFSAFGDIFGDFFSGGGRRVARGANVKVGLQLTFAEAVWGATKDVEISKRKSCGTCGGNGAKPGTTPETCGTCKGKGQVLHSQGFFMIQTACPACRGQGRTIREKCHDCRGAGQVADISTLSVTVPAGVDDGQSLRLAGQGESAPGGGPAGHLYVMLQVAPDDRFVRQGDDVLTEVPISYATAALGGEISVPTLEDECTAEETLTVKPGAQPGDVIVRRGEGVPRVDGRGRGDFVVQLKVVIPRKMSGREEELLREIAKETGEDVKPHKRGFFERLKDL